MDSEFQDTFRRRESLRATLPRSVADHELVRVIASGTYGDVWLARNQLTGTPRAIKIIWRDAFENPKPYEREFEAITRFEPISRSHPGFVHVLQTGRLPNGFYYIMELADDLDPARRDLNLSGYKPATLDASKTKLTVEQAIRVGISLTGSLEVLHGAGLIHRDIKPSNIIFVRGEPKLADIGLVTEISEANSIVGTNGFIAPEGPTTPRADIYALGKLLYEIATGLDRLDFPRLPENATSRDRSIVELNHVLIKACDPNPAQRHPSVQALRDELELLVQGRSIRRVRQLEKTLRLTKAWLATACASLVAGYFLLKFNEARRTAAATVLENRIATAVAEGNGKVDDGDYLGAVHSFARAALLDPKNPEHRLRLGSALAYAPKPGEKKFHSDPHVIARFAERTNILASVLTNHVRLTEIPSGKLIKILDHDASALEIDPDGSSLAIALNNIVTLVDLANWHERDIRFADTVGYLSMADPDHFAVTLTNGDAFLFSEQRLIPSPGKIDRVCLSDSAERLCVLDLDGQFQVLDAHTLMEIFHHHHDTVAYHALFFDSDQKVITSSYDRSAIVWDLSARTPVGHLRVDKGAVVFSALSPDRTLIAIGAQDNTVRLYDGATFAPLPENHTLYHAHRVEWVKFASNTNLVVFCTDGTTHLWTLQNPDLRTELKRTVNVPQGNRLVGRDTELTGIGNKVEGKLLRKPFCVTVPGSVETIAADPDLELIAVGTRDESQDPHAVRLFDRAQHPVGKPMFHDDGVIYVTFSHSGKVIASAGEDYAVRFWNRDGEKLHVMYQKNQIRWIDFSNDDNWVLTGGWDNTVRVWNAHTGAAITVPLKVDNVVEYVSFLGKEGLLVVNSIRNYRIQLPYFNGSVEDILDTIAAPIENQRDF